MSDRYLKIVLTIIALELGWIAVNGTPGVSLSAQDEGMPVIIKGVDLLPNRRNPLPMSLERTSVPVRVTAERALPVETQRPVIVRPEQAIVVETAPQRPLLIQSVPAGTSPKPGPGE